MTPKEKAAVDWLIEEARKTRYGQVGIQFTLRAGQIVKVDKTKYQTELPVTAEKGKDSS
jgi:hypothetical protein